MPWKDTAMSINGVSSSEQSRKRNTCSSWLLFFICKIVRRRTYILKEGDMMSELRYAYGYIRVSTHDREEISDSQENLLRSMLPGTIL